MSAGRNTSEKEAKSPTYEEDCPKPTYEEDCPKPPTDEEIKTLAQSIGVSPLELKIAIEMSLQGGGNADVSPEVDRDAEIAQALEFEDRRVKTKVDSSANQHISLNLKDLINLTRPVECFSPNTEDLLAEINCRRMIFWRKRDSQTQSDDIWVTPFDPMAHFDELSPHIINRYNEMLKKSMTIMEPDEKRTLFQIVFGRQDDVGSPVDRKAVVRWLRHALILNNSEISAWGLLQLTGGPCGVLAGLQSFLLLRLLFSDRNEKLSYIDRLKSFNNEDLKISLIEAISLLIRQAAANNDLFRIGWISPIRASVAQCGSELQELSHGHPKETDKGKKWLDIITDLTVMQATFRTVSDLERFLFRNYSVLFCAPRTSGLLNLIISLVLSRGFGNIIEQDFEGDHERSLIGVFGHCNQEVINLMLSGRASSNLFNGDRVLSSDPTGNAVQSPETGKVGIDLHDRCVLRGVHRKCLTGYLSEMEVMRYCEVGENLKSPYYPIWVVGRNEHFTVIFTTDPDLTKISEDDMAEILATELFDAVDPDRAGIAPAKSLAYLIESAEFADHPRIFMEAHRTLCPPDSGMIILRSDFIRFFIKHRIQSKRWNRWLDCETSERIITAAPSSNKSWFLMGRDDNPTRTKYPLVHYDFRIQTRFESMHRNVTLSRFAQEGPPYPQEPLLPFVSQPQLNVFKVIFNEEGHEGNCEKMLKVLETKWKRTPMRLVRLDQSDAHRLLCHHGYRTFPR